MNRIALLIAIIVVALASTAAVALAWSGSTWTKNTCGADLTTPAEGSGSWKVWVTDDTGATLYSNTLPATKAHAFVAVGGWSNDAGFHVVTYRVANAANLNDGLVTYSQEQMNCSAKVGPVGPQGPPGPPGKDGVGTGGAPGPAGPAGKDGLDGSTSHTSILVPTTPKVCTSRRVYTFEVRKRYKGQLVTAVRASAKGGKVTTFKRGGRYFVRVDYRSLKVGAFTSTRHITVTGVVGGKRLYFNEDVDLCRPKEGHQNAPSASGDAKV